MRAVIPSFDRIWDWDHGGTAGQVVRLRWVGPWGWRRWTGACARAA